MTIAGLALPELSAYDPPVSGEGSLDPMGLAALSDRLAERLVPGVRARMRRVRFVTAMAVSSLVCETLADELPGDGITTPAVCFEWLVLEAFIRRRSADLPAGLPGSQKARTVVARKERLSAATYLKGPRVFGFHGVYKPFAVDAGAVGEALDPGPRAVELVRAWEVENGFEGFADDVRGSDGAQFRGHLVSQTRAALREGRCVTKANSWVFGYLAGSLHPDEAGPAERAVLRSLVASGPHELRNELAGLLPLQAEGLADHELLDMVRGSCSSGLAAVVDAGMAYERLAQLVDTAFRTLCAVSYSMGAQPLTPTLLRDHEVLSTCAKELPSAYRAALERMAAIGSDVGMEDRLGEFGIPRSTTELVELLFSHHDRIQGGKAPAGKRPWFEPLRDGWVVRAAYGERVPPELSEYFVHPVRVEALHQFLRETSQ
jgi:hypothetical protein